MTGWQKAITRMVAMVFLFGIVLIAGLVFHYDGKVLLIGALLIVGLGNIEVLQLILPVITKIVPKFKINKRK